MPSNRCPYLDSNFVLFLHIMGKNLKGKAKDEKQTKVFY